MPLWAVSKHAPTAAFSKVSASIIQPSQNSEVVPKSHKCFLYEVKVVQMLFKLLNCVWQQTFSQEKANKLEGKFKNNTQSYHNSLSYQKKKKLFFSLSCLDVGVSPWVSSFFIDKEVNPPALLVLNCYIVATAPGPKHDWVLCFIISPLSLHFV